MTTTRVKLLNTTLALCAAVGAVACGVDVDDEWEALVPTEGLQIALKPEEKGKTKSIVLNYDKNKVGGDALRGQFTDKLKPAGFAKVSECVSANGTSSAMYVGKDKEIFQVIINLLGDDMLDVELQRATGLPGIILPNPADCKFTDDAAELCSNIDGERCKL